MADLQISINEPRWKKALPDYEKLIAKTLEFLPLQTGDEISILLTNNAEIQQLNRDYRSKDKPTNVLSFPQDEDGMLGDVVLALETLESEAKDAGKTLEAHFTHLFIHGVLHLLGFDHENDEDQHEMETLEIRILESLGIQNPY